MRLDWVVIEHIVKSWNIRTITFEYNISICKHDKDDKDDKNDFIMLVFMRQ